MQETEPGKLTVWLLAIRPKTLPAAVGPVVVGTAVAIAQQAFQPLPALGCFFGAMLLQIAVNLANDYFDAKNNIDSEERLGPVRVTQSGLIPPGQVKAAMIGTLLLAGLVFGYLAVVGGLPIVAIGVASILAALAYSGGPYPIASHGLGELFVFIFFGLVAVGGTYYVQAGILSQLALLAAVPPGLLISAIMVVNNFRDIDTDGTAGKNTLAVKLGRENTILFFRCLLVGSYLVPGGLYIAGTCSWLILLCCGTVPMALKISQQIATLRGKPLNSMLASVAQLSLFHSLLFGVGLAWG